MRAGFLKLSIVSGIVLASAAEVGAQGHDLPLLNSLGRYFGAGYTHGGYHARADGRFDAITSQHPSHNYRSNQLMYPYSQHYQPQRPIQPGIYHSQSMGYQSPGQQSIQLTPMPNETLQRLPQEQIDAPPALPADPPPTSRKKPETTAPPSQPNGQKAQTPEWLAPYLEGGDGSEPRADGGASQELPTPQSTLPGGAARQSDVGEPPSPSDRPAEKPLAPEADPLLPQDASDSLLDESDSLLEDEESLLDGDDDLLLQRNTLPAYPPFQRRAYSQPVVRPVQGRQAVLPQARR